MYSTKENILNVLPEKVLAQLTDDEHGQLIDDIVLNEMIQHAYSIINTYLSVRYQVPFNPVPSIVGQCSCDITVYMLYKRKLEEMPETRRMSYNDAIRILTQIRDGKMEIEGLSTASADFASGALVTSHFKGAEGM